MYVESYLLAIPIAKTIQENITNKIEKVQTNKARLTVACFFNTCST
jgi:hypothetical protein